MHGILILAMLFLVLPVAGAYRLRTTTPSDKRKT